MRPPTYFARTSEKTVINDRPQKNIMSVYSFGAFRHLMWNAPPAVRSKQLPNLRTSPNLPEFASSQIQCELPVLCESKILNEPQVLELSIMGSSDNSALTALPPTENLGCHFILSPSRKRRLTLSRRSRVGSRKGLRDGVQLVEIKRLSALSVVGNFPKNLGILRCWLRGGCASDQCS